MDERPSPLDAEFEDVGDQRRTDRRASDRRAACVRLDPLFATILVNQVSAPDVATADASYVELKPRVRKGIVLNIKA